MSEVIKYSENKFSQPKPLRKIVGEALQLNAITWPVITYGLLAGGPLGWGLVIAGGVAEIDGGIRTIKDTAKTTFRRTKTAS